MEQTVGKILFLDENYQPCGTYELHTPQSLHDCIINSTSIIKVGMDAFNNGKFNRCPRYWVPYDGDIKDFRDMKIKFIQKNPIEEILSKHFRFISIHDIELKIQRIQDILGFMENHGTSEFIHKGFMCCVKENQVDVSLPGIDGDKFSICDFLYSLQVGIDECGESIETIRKQITNYRNDMSLIMETDQNMVHNDIVNYDKFHKVVFCRLYNNLSKTIRELKNRMKNIERQRSYMQNVKYQILTNIWYA